LSGSIPSKKPPQSLLKYNYEIIDKYWDWRFNGTKQGISSITAVKNQIGCGACYAFSAVQEIESMAFLYNKNTKRYPILLSPQEAIDCTYGCDGGETGLVYQMAWQGIQSETSYPYVREKRNCTANKALDVAVVPDYSWFQNTEDEMMKHVATVGPFSVAVCANGWFEYQNGILTNATYCNEDEPDSINHYAQITGFSTMKGIPVWHVRNSWGADWGVDGYIYLKRGINLSAITRFVTWCNAYYK